MISSSVKFLLNDKLIVIKNPDPNQTLLNYIRTELKKTGTKEGCSEGGCGASVSYTHLTLPTIVRV